MSYILDALRKAERQRHSGRVPTLDTLHGVRKRARRAAWPWVVASGVVVAAAVVLLMWPTFRVGAPTVVSPTAVTPMGATPAAPELAHPRTTTPPAPVPAAPRVERPAAKRPADRATDSGGAARPAPAVTAPREEDRPGAAAAPPADGPPSAPAAAAPAPRPADAAQPAQGVLGAPPETAAKLTLDVLVYSEREAERMVFINSRKYVEGQTVDGKLVLEAITREGAILSDQGQRFLLRPRSNPYLQP